MSLLCRFESYMEIPTGDWTAVLTESGGGGTPTITFTAGTGYYWDNDGGAPTGFGFREELEDKLNTASPNANTYTVTLDTSADNGTGKLTIAVDAGTFTLTSVNSDMLAWMGFTSNLSPTASSFQGSKQVEGMWLPDCPANSKYGLNTYGKPIGQTVPMIAPDGTYSIFQGSTQTRNQIAFAMVSKAKTITGEENTANESFETWWLDSVYGGEPWSAGAKVAFVTDRANPVLAYYYNVLNVGEPPYERALDDYDGYYAITLDLLKAV